MGWPGVPGRVRHYQVLARQYGGYRNEIASMDKSIMALATGCEASRRLAEDPGIGPIG